MPTDLRACHLCVTCSSQFAETDGAPRACPICLDERQYIGAGGQQWTTLEEMRQAAWKNVMREQELNLIGIGTEPKFGIGQRALLVRAPEGNILWDCVSFLAEPTIRFAALARWRRRSRRGPRGRSTAGVCQSPLG